MNENLEISLDLKNTSRERPIMLVKESPLVGGQIFAIDGNQPSSFVVRICVDHFYYKGKAYPVVTILQHSYSKTMFYYVHDTPGLYTVSKLVKGKSYFSEYIQEHSFATSLALGAYFDTLGMRTADETYIKRCLSGAEIIEYTSKPTGALSQVWEILPIHTQLVDDSRLGTIGLFTTKIPLTKQLQNELQQQLDSIELKIRKLRTLYTLDELNDFPSYCKLVCLLQQPQL